ncbi:MAG TPA: hypothetical protein VL996_08265 [Methylocella sp.]|nr:hypothetical protein [Methylocella sp.]
MPNSGVESPVSEAELHAFVDGGLERGRQAAVQAFLAASPADAARVETWQRQNERIRAAFASMRSPPLTGSFPLDIGQSGALQTFQAWRERWRVHLVAAAAFTSGVLLAAGGEYLIHHTGLADGDPVGGGANEIFALQTTPAPRALARPADPAAPILPNLPVNGLKLAGVRAMPGEQGQRLCLFYTRPDGGNLALCAEITPGPSETDARLSGAFPSASISWRQKGAHYALSGALQEPELRALAEAVRGQVEAFDTRR